MNSSLKRGLFIVTLTGMISFSGEKAEASEEASQMSLPGVGIEAVLDDCLASGLVTEADSSLVSGTMGEYSDMAFTDVGADTFLFVRSEPTTQSDWVGKLYRDDAAKIKGPVGGVDEDRERVGHRLCVHGLHYNRKRRAAKSPGAHTGLRKSGRGERIYLCGFQTGGGRASRQGGGAAG